MSRANILLHVTGSISAYKACALVSALKADGFSIRVSMTAAAREFVGPASFEGLSGNPVEQPFFAGTEDPIPHITLSQRWADLILVYPASANTINRLAAGLADDVFGAAFLANNYRKPVWIAPAMNAGMFAHPAVVRSLETLERDGARILPTGEGRLACGSAGKGRLLEPEALLNLIRSAFPQATILDPAEEAR